MRYFYIEYNLLFYYSFNILIMEQEIVVRKNAVREIL